MPYRTRPRFQARVQLRETARQQTPPKKKNVVVPAGRWEPGHVLDALNELHNAPDETPPGRRAGG